MVPDPRWRIGERGAATARPRSSTMTASQNIAARLQAGFYKPRYDLTVVHSLDELNTLLGI